MVIVVPAAGIYRGAEILDVPAMPVIEGKSVVNSRGVLPAVMVQVLLLFHVPIAGFAVDMIDSGDD